MSRIDPTGAGDAGLGRGTASDRTRPDHSVGEYLTLLTGIIFLVVGIAGFFVTGFDNFADHVEDEKLFGVFMVNPLHNLVHLAFGVLALLMWNTVRKARTFGTIMLVGYGAVFLLGLAMVDEDWDFLNLNWADNWLHLALALLGAVIIATATRSVDVRDGTTTGTRTGTRARY